MCFGEKQTQLPLRVKLGVYGSVVLMQIATMLHVTIDGYGRRTWDAFQSGPPGDLGILLVLGRRDLY